MKIKYHHHLIIAGTFLLTNCDKENTTPPPYVSPYYFDVFFERDQGSYPNDQISSGSTGGDVKFSKSGSAYDLLGLQLHLGRSTPLAELHFQADTLVDGATYTIAKDSSGGNVFPGSLLVVQYNYWGNHFDTVGQFDTTYRSVSLQVHILHDSLQGSFIGRLRWLNYADAAILPFFKLVTNTFFSHCKTLMISILVKSKSNCMAAS